MEMQINDYVMYRSTGVCRFLGEKSQSPDGETEILYYKLKPMNDQNSTYYIPVRNADSKLRPLMTRDEVLALIDIIPKTEEDNIWTDNRRERRELYSKILRSDDQFAMMRMISSLYFRKLSSEETGKRFSSMDETAMKNAENLMLQEIGIVLGLEPEDVRKFIDERVQQRG